jgi:hypothetical protein
VGACPCLDGARSQFVQRPEPQRAWLVLAHHGRATQIRRDNQTGHRCLPYVLALVASIVGLVAMQLGMRAMAQVSLPDGLSLATLDVHLDGR